VEKYFRAFLLGLQSAMEYRMNFLMSILSTFFPIIIQVFMWTAIFKSSPNKIIYGYTYSQMIMYSIMAAIISKLVASGIEYDIANDIKNGILNKFIVQPIGYYFYKICGSFGQKTFQLGVVTILSSILLFIVNLKMNLNIGYQGILLAIPVIILALILNILMSCTISLISFWITEAWAAFMILDLFINISGGGVFPLDIFGDKVLAVMNVLPFEYLIYFPINVIERKTSIPATLEGMAIQGIWILVLLVCIKAGWKVGIKKYVAVGG